MEQIFIDRFIVPQSAKAEFLERMAVNRNFIKELPGFTGDEVYEHRDDDGSFRYITIAVWTSKEALDRAKTLVQTEYQREGFDLRAMLERLEIRMERELYHRLFAQR
jgi:quinol monooxygenase YgiN